MSDERPCCDCPVEAQRREDEAKREWYARVRRVAREHVVEARDKQLAREGQGWRAWMRARGWRKPATHHADRAADRYRRNYITVPLLMGDGSKRVLTRPREGWER